MKSKVTKAIMAVLMVTAVLASGTASWWVFYEPATPSILE